MTYDAKNISVLKGLDAVKKRPGMYIGDPSYAFLKMILEVLDNSVDEFTSGYCTDINIIINNDYISVEDNGRGIPVDIHEEEGKTALELVMTKLHAGGKFDESNYSYSSGLHGVGVSVVNALSKFLKVHVYRDNTEYFMEFIKGIPKEDLKIIGSTNKQGTKVIFYPEEEYFDGIPEKNEIINKLEEISFLNKGIKINLNLENKNYSFYATQGIKDYAL